MDWLDAEVARVEDFYKTKKSECIERYLLLQDQLFNLREQHGTTALIKQKHRNSLRTDSLRPKSSHHHNDHHPLPLHLSHNVIFTPLGRRHKRGKSTEHTETETVTETNAPATSSSSRATERSTSRSKSRDYVRKVRDDRISYSTARQQLKLAVVELYRELEMLKSFRLLNLTAVRKIVKKFDKASGHTSLPGYMAKMSNNYLSKTDTLDTLIAKAGDMFTVYFENGNRKLAFEKLHASPENEEHYLENFATGVFLGLSVPFMARAIWMGLQHLDRGDPDTLFLFQIWGGFFLVIMFFCLFALSCIVWTKNKINYSFVFEFDPLSHLNPKQIGTLPAFLLLVMSVLSWCCFEDFWAGTFRKIYYPPIFLAFSLIVLFLPFDILQLSARKWLCIAFWRLLFSGIYPVEFRDLVLGNICCSMTYSISNAAFFFCLYSTHWSGLLPGDPSGSYCGSNHSRWMGFISTVPCIWRFLQCGRRYLDTGDIFPHLANMCKYSLLICTNAFLSAYRIKLDSHTLRTWYIVFASLNTVVSTFWDIFMDWSLMQVGSHNFLLRDELAFKFTSPYYAAMVLDTVLRCNWFFYIIYENQLQQSAKISFFIALSEALRRVVWVFFRVENEHCCNVTRSKASRDITLPYATITRKKSTIVSSSAANADRQWLLSPTTHPNDEEATGGTTPLLLRKPSGSLPFGKRLFRFMEPVLETVGKTLRSAHARDFERRRKDDVDVDDDDHEEAGPHLQGRQFMDESVMDTDSLWDSSHAGTRNTSPVLTEDPTISRR